MFLKEAKTQRVISDAEFQSLDSFSNRDVLYDKYPADWKMLFDGMHKRDLAGGYNVQPALGFLSAVEQLARSNPNERISYQQILNVAYENKSIPYEYYEAELRFVFENPKIFYKQADYATFAREFAQLALKYDDKWDLFLRLSKFANQKAKRLQRNAEWKERFGTAMQGMGQGLLAVSNNHAQPQSYSLDASRAHKEVSFNNNQGSYVQGMVDSRGFFSMTDSQGKYYQGTVNNGIVAVSDQSGRYYNGVLNNDGSFTVHDIDGHTIKGQAQ
jgi:hypothetical protein